MRNYTYPSRILLFLLCQQRDFILGCRPRKWKRYFLNLSWIVGEETGGLPDDPVLVTTKAINYQELTVVLLAALQEWQTEALKAQINEER